MDLLFVGIGWTDIAIYPEPDRGWGILYGFNGLQIAARRPPALKAIVTICSTDDRYADDAHYMGGTFLTKAGLEWAFFFFSLMCLPPDPALVGDSWRACLHVSG